MQLISEQDIANIIKLKSFGDFGLKITKALMYMLKLEDINELYNKFSHLEGLQFIDAILEELNIQVEIPSADSHRIPTNQPFIAIANHPLGAIDGLIMLKILLTSNPQAKIMANFLLGKIVPLRDYICAVNPFETRKEAYNSSSGVRQAIAQLAKGYPLGIFPAGEVSTRKGLFFGEICDKKWDSTIIKLIKKANVAVVPMFFEAKNSRIFYFLASINDNLRTIRLPAEVSKSKDKSILVRIGNPISADKISAFDNIGNLSTFLRKRTYILGKPFVNETAFSFLYNNEVYRAPESIITTKVDLRTHFERLITDGKLLLSKNTYQLFFTQLHYDNPILNEIGCLREVTFREVGEGTMNDIDLDNYDQYYHHLILWDTAENQIIGAYRLGIGSEIYKNYGITGFYLTELFKFKKKSWDLLRNSIEMGRAFIQSHYQNKPFPLFLLWQGIGKVVKMFPETKYLIGAASISSIYCKYSRALIVEFLSQNYLDINKSNFIYPKTPFNYKLLEEDLQLLNNSDLKKLDKLIGEIEPSGIRIPTLIKKYLLHDAKVLGFNLDPNFCNAIDVLIYLDVNNIDREKFKV